MNDFIDDFVAYTVICFFLVLEFFFGIKNLKRLGKILERKYDEKIEREEGRG